MLISGFTQPDNEFTTPYRVVNRHACNGCWNDPRLRFLLGLADARAGRNDAARTAWQALLADAPANAPWREVVEARLRALP